MRKAHAEKLFRKFISKLNPEPDVVLAPAIFVTLTISFKMNQQILTAIIAASSVLSGVIISQGITLLLSFLDKRHKKQILLRQKYEEMVFHFNESLLYPTEIDNCKTVDQIVRMPHNIPAMKAISLARLYIPELKIPLENYIQNNILFFREVTSYFDVNIPASVGAQSVRKHGGLSPARKELHQAKDAVFLAIMANAHKYAIA